MIYIVGGAGAPNYGDELIVRSWLEYLDRTCSGEKVWVESNSVTVSSLLNSSVNSSASFIDPLREIARQKKGIGFWGQVVRGWNFAVSTDHSPSKLYVLLRNIMSSCRRLHIVGGGYINSNSEVSGFLLGAIGGFSKRYGVPSFATGLGLMPLSRPPEASLPLVREVLSQFSMFEVRDPESYQLISAIGNFDNIVNGLDDCFMAQVKRSESYTHGSSSTLHISCGKHAISKVAAFIDKNFEVLNANFDRQVFWECYPAGDLPAYTEMKSRFKDIELIPVESLLDRGFSVQGGDHMITSRFHPHMMFSRAGGKGFFVSDSEYYNIKHGSVLALGSSFRRISEKMPPIHEADLSESLGSIKSQGFCLEKMSLARDIYL